MEQKGETNEITTVINSSSKVEEVCQILKENGFPENTVRKFEEEFIDGEGFLELENDSMYTNLIPQYGLQVKFKRFFKKMTGRELKTTALQVEEVARHDQDGTQDIETPVNVLTTSVKDINKMVPYPAPLPVFTELVQTRLSQGNGLSCLNRIIAELAEFYIARGYNISTSPEYRNVGRTVVEKCPSLGMPGNAATPWQAFCKSLSARIRNQRCSMKRKSDVVSLVDGNSPAKKPSKQPAMKLTFGVSDRQMPILTEEKYDQYVEEMQNECKKTKVDKKHIQSLMRNTFSNRREYIQSLPDGDVQTILRKFPVFEMESGVFEEMKMIIGKEKFDCMSSEFDRVMVVVEKMRDLSPLEEDCSDVEVDKRDLENLAYLHRQTAFERGKGAKSKPFWKEVEVTKDLTKALQCAKEEPPFVFFCIHSEKVKGVYICADGKIVVKSEQNDIKTAVLLLLAAYYVFDLQYPKIYNQALGFLQQHIIGHNFDKMMCQKSKKFSARFNLENDRQKQHDVTC